MNGLAIIGVAVVGFMLLARRDGTPRPTQLRAHQEEDLSVEVLQSPGFEPGVDEIGDSEMDDVRLVSEEPAEVDEALVVGGEP